MIALIIGVDIPNNKRVLISLAYIWYWYISITSVICKNSKVNENTRVKDLKEKELTYIHNEIGKFHDEGNLLYNNAFNIKILIDIGCYLGIRNKKIVS